MTEGQTSQDQATAALMRELHDALDLAGARRVLPADHRGGRPRSHTQSVTKAYGAMRRELTFSSCRTALGRRSNLRGLC